MPSSNFALKKFFVVALAATLAVVGLSACSTGSGLVAGSSISIAEVDTLSSFNADVPTSSDAQQANHDLAQLIRPSFYTLDENGKEIANLGFGSVKVISKSPFTVAYKLTGKAKWSDGTAVSADDLLLSWLAAADPLKAGFSSRASASGLRFASEVPQVSADKLTLTVKFAQSIADWRTAMQIGAAAHVTAKRAFGVAGFDEALKRFESSVTANSLEDEKLLAEHYYKAYAFTALNAANPGLKLSAGAYLIDKFTPGQSITLKANPKFDWGKPARIETVNVLLFSDATSMLAAMQNKSVDIAALEESGLATLSSLVGVAKANGENYKLTASNDIEAVLLNFGAASVFSSAKAGANAVALRAAFLNLIPRTKIQAALASGSPVIDARSWIYSNASNYYQPFVQANGSTSYMIQNAELAAEQMAALSIAKPVAIRVLFDANNPRAKQEFSLLGQYAASVGFTLLDASSKEPAVVAASGEYDVYITTVPLAGEDGANAYWFANNLLNNFSDPKLDQLLASYGAKSRNLDQISVLKDIDAELYAAQFGLPLYQVPSLLVYSKRVSALMPAPYGGSATYGYWNWQLASN